MKLILQLSLGLVTSYIITIAVEESVNLSVTIPDTFSGVITLALIFIFR